MLPEGFPFHQLNLYVHINKCCIYLRKRPQKAYWHVEYNSHGLIEALHYWRPLNQNKNVQ